MALTEPEVRGLVEAHRAGDEDAFARIAQLHYDELLGHAVRLLGEHEAAEDAVQEAFVRAYRGLPAFNGEYRLRAWLHRILRNVCIDEIGRRSREARLLERAAALEPRASSAEPDAIEQAEARQAVAAALATLPAPYRNALVLRYAEELSFRDVAAVTGVSEDNARARVHRGRTALRRLLSGPAVLVVWIAQLGRRGERSAIEAVAVSGLEPAGTTQAAGHMGSLLTQKAAVLVGIVGLATAVGAPSPSPTRADEPAAIEAATPDPPGASGPASDAPTSIASRSAGPTDDALVPPPGLSPSATTTTSVAPTTSTTVMAAVPTTEPSAEEVPAPAEPLAQFLSDRLSAVDEGERIIVHGSTSAVLGGETHTGWLSLVLDEVQPASEPADSAPPRKGSTGADEPDGASDDGAAPGDAFDQPRTYTGTLHFERSDWRYVQLELTVTVQRAGDGYEIVGQYRLSGGEPFGIPAEGEIDVVLSAIEGDAVVLDGRLQAHRHS